MNHETKAYEIISELDERDDNHDERDQNSAKDLYPPRSCFLHPASEKLAVEPDNAPRCENEPKPKGDSKNRTFQEAHGSNENKMSDGGRDGAPLGVECGSHLKSGAHSGPPFAPSLG